MFQQSKRISLEGKMDDWGPFGENEGKWLIFSIGNPVEGHGFALPRNIDDIQSQRVAHLISCKTGARYVAHIPWATDNYTSIATDWAPKSIPVEELVENIIKFIKFHIDIYKKMDLPTSRVLIYSGHGGNNPLVSYEKVLKDALNLDKLIISTTEGVAEENVDRILVELDKISEKIAKNGENPKKIRGTLVKILLSNAHAGQFEHSLGAALGVLDEEKLDIMNEELERDFDAALAKWPPLGGLGGFLLAGEEYTKALGTRDNDKFGLWKCMKTLRKLNNGRVLIFKELGELILNLLAEYYSEMILNDL
ncbi:MAG: hypothetical protein EAX91_17285 [Candidatus Lokiarchaeota archaeon]|nr:hypothetical protein [Candidatus Lokiarchaeota archaeon]